MHTQLSNEQARSRDRLFLVDNLKSTNELLSRDNNRLHMSNTELEQLISTLKKKQENFEDLRTKEKEKLESISAFCTLLQNRSLSGGEITQKLIEFPSIIIDYLNGKSKELTFKALVTDDNTSVKESESDKVRRRKLSSQCLEPSPQLSFISQNMDMLEGEPRSEDIKFIHKDMEDLKNTVTTMLQSISQWGKSQNASRKSSLSDLERNQHRPPQILIPSTNSSNRGQNEQPSGTNQRKLFIRALYLCCNRNLLFLGEGGQKLKQSTMELAQEE